MGKHRSTHATFFPTPGGRRRKLVAAGVGVMMVATASGIALAAGTDSTPSVYSAIAPVLVLSRALAAGSQTDFPVTGGTVPATATSVVISATALDGSAASSLYVYATGDAKPASANLRWDAGQTVTVPIVVGVGTNGDVHVTPDTAVTVKFSVVGYYAPAAAPGSKAYGENISELDVTPSSLSTALASVTVPPGAYEVQATLEFRSNTTDAITCFLLDSDTGGVGEIAYTREDVPQYAEPSITLLGLDQSTGIIVGRRPVVDSTISLNCASTSTAEGASATAFNIDLIVLQLSSETGWTNVPGGL